jgi:hypothetical protein
VTRIGERSGLERLNGAIVESLLKNHPVAPAGVRHDGRRETAL